MKNFIKNLYRNNFVYNGSEKLSKLSITLIILLDIIIFTIVNLGIDFQIKVINNPSVTYPYKCRDILNSSNIFDFNQYIYSKNSYEYYDNYQEIKTLQIDSRCTTIYEKIDAIKKEHDIEELRKRFNKLAQNLQIIEEKVKIEESFSKSKSVEELSKFIKDNKDEINDDILKATKKYEIKRDLVTLAFLLPLLILFFYLMKRYLQNSKYTLYVIYKNIFFVILIPTIFSVFSLISTFIPKIFVEKLLMFFYNLEIPFVVYYFVVLVVTILFVYLIVKLQKKYKDEKKFLFTNIEYFNKSLCNKCGNKIDYINMNFCPSCNNSLKIECKNCFEITYKDLNYCIKCGHDIKED